MEKEIYGEVGNFEKGKTSSAPLQELVGVSNTFNIWRYYGNHKNDKKNIEKLMSFCFVQSLAEIEVKSKFFDADFKI